MPLIPTMNDPEDNPKRESPLPASPGSACRTILNNPPSSGAYLAWDKLWRKWEILNWSEIHCSWIETAECDPGLRWTHWLPLPPPPGSEWHVLIQSWAGLVWHPVEVIKLGPSRCKVRFLDDNIKGKRGSVHTVPTGALRSPNAKVSDGR